MAAAVAAGEAAEAAADCALMVVLRDLLPMPVPAVQSLRPSLSGLSSIVRRRVKTRWYQDQWAADAVSSLNWLVHGASPAHFHELSSAQQSGLQHIRDVIREAGASPCNGPTAFRELVGHLPGYSDQPEPSTPFQHDLVSLPADGVTLCNAADYLPSHAKNLWLGWNRFCKPRKSTLLS